VLNVRRIAIILTTFAFALGFLAMFISVPLAVRHGVSITDLHASLPFVGRDDMTWGALTADLSPAKMAALTR
jgi:hypothetical protein